MRKLTILWWLFAAVVAYGSLYPFDFRAVPIGGSELRDFIASCCGRPGRGDVLGNVLLFMPYGFLGIASTRGNATTARLAFVVGTGTLFALALQVVQLWLPARDENLQDVLWNAGGIGAGAGVGILLRGWLVAANRPGRTEMVPLLLIGSWLMYRLLPFVPSLDLQQIRDSVKPLLIHPELGAVAIIHDAVGWLVVASALQWLRPAPWRADPLVPTIAGVLALEILIVDNAVSASNAAGALLAVAVWYAGLRHARSRAAVLSVLLVVVIVAQGLAPVAGGAPPVRFSWLPFRGMPGASMYLNVQAICEKVFLYGSLVCFLGRTRLGMPAATVAVVIVVAVLEFIQQFVAGHTAEITDPLLVIAAALTIAALSGRPSEPVPAGSKAPQRQRWKSRRVRRFRQRSAATDAAIAGDAPATMRDDLPVAQGDAGTPGDAWVERRVNLRADQLAFLVDRARHAQSDVSAVVRQIITDYSDRYPLARSVPNLPTTVLHTPWRWRKRIGREEKMKKTWVHETVSVSRHQADYIDRIAKRQQLSFSRVTRRIIEKVIESS